MTHIDRHFWRRCWGCLALALLTLAGTGCDPTAKTSSNDRAFATSERLSRQHESCASSLDCAEGLRCFHQVCRSPEASLIGDYHAAVGARALAGSNGEKAATAYTAAVNRYQSDKVPVPPALECAKGRALVALRQDRDQAEKAARALHSCLLGAPAGSKLREQALADLAILGDSGLDPELLARAEPMDTYLTKQPARPSTESLVVEASGDARTKAGTYTEFLALIEGAPMREKLVGCWESHWKATKKKELSVTIPFRYRFIRADFVEDDRDKLSIEGDEPAAGSPERCVHDALATAAEEFSRGKRTGNRWEAAVTVDISQ